MNIDMARGHTSAPARDDAIIRHDWTMDEVTQLFAPPFADLSAGTVPAGRRRRALAD